MTDFQAKGGRKMRGITKKTSNRGIFKNNWRTRLFMVSFGVWFMATLVIPNMVAVVFDQKIVSLISALVCLILLPFSLFGRDNPW